MKKKKNESGANRAVQADKKEKKKEMRGGGKERRKEQREGERKRKKNSFSFLSKIYGYWAIGFHRGKKQSSFTRLELRVGTKIWEFRRTPRGKEIFYLEYF